ncbi:triosephosphate isomerase [Eubacterium callanderi]|uniref:Triosephosphate isomerase n=5 Tax=Eubacterium TaxID=1730 RepID=A0A6N3EE40_EUBLI|nr:MULTISPECIES: triose-phosphate isomerase [Eubacterium]MBS4859797.1 triose-phosphate isomerase [Eubacterium limosum]MDR4073649.1 triose-phosphate isomerase [Eubacterium sp.]OEZ05522.1 triosephosphate isomerase [[Butyribacterium] methylotrophicum]ADO39238.1 triosephosphate isomerase [Eubacterium callanderi]MBO1702844.1 triose-phosphate isomerase [Eubacterium callanderi]
MKKMFLGTNWKMNKTTAEGLSYTDALTDIISKYPEFEFFIIPPYVQLWKIRELIDSKKSTLKLGAQNVHYEDAGQFTGEISPTQLKEIGVDILEIGHSERRQYFNETDYTVNLKTLAALKHGFTPLVCIGDSMQDKKYGVSKEVLARQLKIALHDVPADAIGKFWVAYEPVWAIGVNGIPAEAPLVNDIHNHLRDVTVELYGEAGRGIPLLFGGSVNIDNARQYAPFENVNGLFIGRSAWQPDSFEAIMKSLHETLA